MRSYDLIIIGAGIAGMTCAMGASNKGIKNILIMDSEDHVGGIMNQCIHNGFGEGIIGSTVTGPEYVDYIEESIDRNSVQIMLKTTVLDVNTDKIVTYVNAQDGVKEVKATAIVFATGAKERYFGEMMLVAKKLVGIQTLGEVHKIINLEGYLPGKNSVLLVKNKWGFIVARRILIEGGKVEGVVIEKGFEEIATPEIKEIINGFDIPIIDNSKITHVTGKDRLESVTIENLKTNTSEVVKCDALILTVDFEANESLAKKNKIKIPDINQVLLSNVYETSEEGFFACGNIIYGEESFNQKNINGIECGSQAASYIKSMYK